MWGFLRDRFIFFLVRLSGCASSSTALRLIKYFIVPFTIASQLILKALYKAAQANAQHLTDISQLYQIQPAQPALYVADKRLWAIKRFGEVALG